MVVILHVNSLKDYAGNLKLMPIFYEGSKIIGVKTFSESNGLQSPNVMPTF